MATDPETGDKGPRTVKALIRNTGPHLMVAVGTNKAGVENTTSDTIDATDNHPFWVQSRGEWVEAIALQPGDVLLDEQGNDILVTELAVTGQDLTAYNLTIEGIHTYYAGTQPTLVHNCGISTQPGDEWGIRHVQKRHVQGGSAVDGTSSLFYENVDLGQLARQSNGQSGFINRQGNRQYNVSANDRIGVTDRSYYNPEGTPTSKYAIIRDPDSGWLKTMFPRR